MINLIWRDGRDGISVSGFDVINIDTIVTESIIGTVYKKVVRQRNYAMSCDEFFEDAAYWLYEQDPKNGHCEECFWWKGQEKLDRKLSI